MDATCFAMLPRHGAVRNTTMLGHEDFRNSLEHARATGPILDLLANDTVFDVANLFGNLLVCES